MQPLQQRGWGQALGQEHRRSGRLYSLLATLICLGRTASTLGRCTVSTPFLHSAVIRVLSIDSWMVKTR